MILLVLCYLRSVRFLLTLLDFSYFYSGLQNSTCVLNVFNLRYHMFSTCADVYIVLLASCMIFTCLDHNYFASASFIWYLTCVSDDISCVVLTLQLLGVLLALFHLRSGGCILLAFSTSTYVNFT